MSLSVTPVEQNPGVWERWNGIGVMARAAILEQWAAGLHRHHCAYAAAMVRFQCRQARRWLGEITRLPGPTGESNELYLAGRGRFLVLVEAQTPGVATAGQLAAALVAGNTVVLGFDSESHVSLSESLFQAGLPDQVLQRCNGLNSAAPGTWLEQIGPIEGAVFCGSAAKAHAIDAALAARCGAVVQLIAETDTRTYGLLASPRYLLHFVTERTRTINLTAIGGNPALLELD